MIGTRDFPATLLPERSGSRPACPRAASGEPKDTSGAGAMKGFGVLAAMPSPPGVAIPRRWILVLGLVLLALILGWIAVSLGLALAGVFLFPENLLYVELSAFIPVIPFELLFLLVGIALRQRLSPPRWLFLAFVALVGAMIAWSLYEAAVYVVRIASIAPGTGLYTTVILEQPSLVPLLLPMALLVLLLIALPTRRAPAPPVPPPGELPPETPPLP